MRHTTATQVSATGTALPVSGRGGFSGARLVAGVDAATAIVRETDGSGRILTKLSANAANAVDETVFGAQYSGNVHVTLTGTSPVFLLFND